MFVSSAVLGCRTLVSANCRKHFEHLVSTAPRNHAFCTSKATSGLRIQHYCLRIPTVVSKPDRS